MGQIVVIFKMHLLLPIWKRVSKVTWSFLACAFSSSVFSLFSSIRSTSFSLVLMLAGSSCWQSSISRTMTSLAFNVWRSSRILRSKFLKGRNKSGKSLLLRSTLSGPLGLMSSPKTMARRGMANMRLGSHSSIMSWVIISCLTARISVSENRTIKS